MRCFVFVLVATFCLAFAHNFNVIHATDDVAESDLLQNVAGAEARAAATADLLAADRGVAPAADATALYADATTDPGAHENESARKSRALLYGYPYAGYYGGYGGYGGGYGGGYYPYAYPRYYGYGGYYPYYGYPRVFYG